MGIQSASQLTEFAMRTTNKCVSIKHGNVNHASCGAIGNLMSEPWVVPATGLSFQSVLDLCYVSFEHVIKLQHSPKSPKVVTVSNHVCVLFSPSAKSDDKINDLPLVETNDSNQPDLLMFMGHIQQNLPLVETKSSLGPNTYMYVVPFFPNIITYDI